MKTIHFTLHPFLGDGSAVDHTITGWVGREHDTLTLDYRLQGPLNRLRIAPKAQMPLRSPDLWKETCFECFLRTAPEVYWEVNLSPAGHWNVYRFDAYRQGMREEQAFAALPVEVSTKKDAFRLTAAVDLSAIDPTHGPLKVALGAVMRTVDDQISYWALAHPGLQPDFHHPKSFLLAL
ncbi:MAG: DOMON-like domain-containing protein [Desulfatitalea sp.]